MNSNRDHTDDICSHLSSRASDDVTMSSSESLSSRADAGGAKVVLVVPAYNAAEWLKECLVSIAMQSYKDFKAIVVDDGSTDDTREIVNEFCSRDARFSLITTEHRGVSAARNAGVSAADGEWIGFVDADDCLHPQALRRIIAALDRTGADLGIAEFRQGTDFGRYVASVDSTLSEAREVEIYTYTEAMLLGLYQKRLINSPWGWLMRRRLIPDSKVFREGIRFEDLDSFYKLFGHATKIALLPEPLYFYRKNPKSFLQRFTPEHIDVLDVTDRMVEFMRENHPELVKAAMDRRFSAHYNTLLKMYASGYDDKAAIMRCLAVIREGRGRALRDRHVRLKNKVGALMSFGGMPILKLLAKL